jgi:uncharacterized protein (DUF488 family)
MLYTFGYEGIDISEFLDRLRLAKVKLVLDIRELPLSRKKGFSKRSLESALASAGISYRHLSALGCPKTIRNQYKKDHDWVRYSREFVKYLKSQTAALDEVTTLAGTSSVCLVCFEANHLLCHRSLVAEAAVGDEVKHLRAKAEKAVAQIPDAA